MKIQCSPELENIMHLYKNNKDTGFPPIHQRSQRQIRGTEYDLCNKLHLEMTSEKINGHTYYNASVSNYF